MLEVELEAEGLEVVVVLVGAEGPGVALGGEEGRARGVESAESAAESRVVLGFGDLGDVVGLGAEIDEACGAVGIRPGDDEGGRVGGTFGRPVGEHLLRIAEKVQGVGDRE